MNNGRAKSIFRLVAKKDPNVLGTIRREKGEKKFKTMSGVAIYRNAKKLWNKFGKIDNWGK